VMNVFAILYAVIGLAGLFLSLISMAGFLAASGQNASLPTVYAVIGAVGGAILALIYNLVAQFTGGISIELG
jgi:hypothetical protein